LIDFIDKRHFIYIEKTAKAFSHHRISRFSLLLSEKLHHFLQRWQGHPENKEYVGKAYQI